MSTHPGRTHPIRPLTRLEQLTLNTWRWAALKLHETLDPHAVLEHAALHAVLASLRDLDDPFTLFVRHAQARSESRGWWTWPASLPATRRDHRR